MNIVDGREVYTELPELVAPRHSALLVIDVQKDFCSRGGAYDDMKHPIERTRQMLSNVRLLLDSAHHAGALVVYAQNTNLPGHRSTSAPYIRYRAIKRGYGYERESTVESTTGWEIVDEVAPIEGDLVVRKHRSSAFAGTDLDQLLRVHGVETVVLTGTTTDGCVESTARAAEALDYYVVLAPDACSAFPQENHDTAVTCMSRRYDVIESRVISDLWHRPAMAPTRAPSVDHRQP